MNNVGQSERKTQERVIELFKNLGYDYLGNLKDEDNSNIREDDLANFLNGKYSETLIKKAIEKFKKTAELASKNFYEVNRDVYDLLRYGVNVREGLGQNKQTVRLIDWDNPANNHFAIAEEVTVGGSWIEKGVSKSKRPDIVLYVNGIATCILELKRSTVSVSEGIRQNIGNQESGYIKHFFTTIQFLFAGNDTEGLRYGTTETPEKYWVEWKEDTSTPLCVRSLSEVETKLDKQLSQLCEKSRLLDLIYNFIVFDAGTKKTCRHNQYFGVKKSQERIGENRGGVIWHTQGSGKSLTMVWLAKWLLENNHDARVLLLTDRTELDEQIEKVFDGVKEKIWRAKTAKKLFEKLNETTERLMCSLVHKFGRVSNATGETVYDFDVADLRRNLPSNFSVKGKLFVFVDECHRSHSGKLHDAMKEVLGENTIFIGFTGTPLLKIDKVNSQVVWGNYIHTYKYNEAVQDGVVLDLRYEARDVEQEISSQEKIDEWFDRKTANLTDVARAELKRKWGTMQNVLSSRNRMEKIVMDIEADFDTKPRLKSGRGNAMLVASSIYEACQYYKIFQDRGYITKCAVVTSYEPNALGTESDEFKIYTQMLNGKNTENFEQDVKNLFVKSPGQMQILIVVNKLLTGFDAPSATYLYIDKNMRDHGLFQAICRVNRLDSNDENETEGVAVLNKEYGYIVDYRDLFQKLEKSVQDYTAGAFDGFDAEDVLGLLKDKTQLGEEDLNGALEVVRALCEPVQPPKASVDYIRYFCGDTENVYSLKENEQKRLNLYKAVASLVRRFQELKGSLKDAGYTQTQAENLQKEVERFQIIKREIKMASGDYIDLKVHDKDMRNLFNQYILAKDSEVLSNFNDKGLVDLLIDGQAEEIENGFKGDQESTAEAIEGNIRKLIIDEMQTNPKYYEKMSVLLTDLIKQRKNNAVQYKEYLQKLAELAKDVKDPNIRTPDERINTRGKKAICDFLDGDVELSLEVYKAIEDNKLADWKANTMKSRKIKNAISEQLPNKTSDEINSLFEIIKNNAEF